MVVAEAANEIAADGGQADQTTTSWGNLPHHGPSTEVAGDPPDRRWKAEGEHNHPG